MSFQCSHMGNSGESVTMLLPTSISTVKSAWPIIMSYMFSVPLHWGAPRGGFLAHSRHLCPFPPSCCLSYWWEQQGQVLLHIDSLQGRWDTWLVTGLVGALPSHWRYLVAYTLSDQKTYLQLAIYSKQAVRQRERESQFCSVYQLFIQF